MSTLRHTLSLAFFVLATTASGCGGPLTLTANGTQRDPGAEARIEVSDLPGGNHLLTLTLQHLTPPERLGSGNTTFLAWIRPPSGAAILAGQLGYAPDARQGTVTMTTPLQRFTVLVTAEPTPNSSAPSDFVVVSADLVL
jgi:hypothetical protein